MCKYLVLLLDLYDLRMDKYKYFTYHNSFLIILNIPKISCNFIFNKYTQIKTISSILLFLVG